MSRTPQPVAPDPNGRAVDRVLDIDLDFFVYGTANWVEPDGPRLDPGEYSVWERSEAMSFLTDRCCLGSPRSGAAVEHHSEVFFCWRDAIEHGVLHPPFDVVHVDAHADLGLGDSGYVYLMTELLHLPLEDRRHPKVGHGGLGDGNFLAFAIANRWINSLIYVVGGRHEDYWWEPEEPEGRPADLLTYLHEDLDPDRDLQLRVLDAEQLRRAGSDLACVPPLALEPKVPFRWASPRNYHTTLPFTYIALARSPAFTPPSGDAIFDDIHRRFITQDGRLRPSNRCRRPHSAPGP